jgi:hypothetical protein
VNAEIAALRFHDKDKLLLLTVLGEPFGPALRREREQRDQRYHEQKHYNEKEESHEVSSLLA